MPRPLLSNLIQALRHDTAEAPPTAESHWTEAEDAGRLRWDSWSRTHTDPLNGSCDTRAREDHVLMLHSCLVSVSPSGPTLFRQAAWSFRSGGFQRRRTIEEEARNGAEDTPRPTRLFRGNRDAWAETMDTTVSMKPRHDSVDSNMLQVTGSPRPSSLRIVGGDRPRISRHTSTCHLAPDSLSPSQAS